MALNLLCSARRFAIRGSIPGRRSSQRRQWLRQRTRARRSRRCSRRANASAGSTWIPTSWLAPRPACFGSSLPRAFEFDEPTAGAQAEYLSASRLLPSIDDEEIRRVAERLFADGGCVGYLAMPAGTMAPTAEADVRRIFGYDRAPL